MLIAMKAMISFRCRSLARTTIRCGVPASQICLGAKPSAGFLRSASPHIPSIVDIHAMSVFRHLKAASRAALHGMIVIGLLGLAGGRALAEIHVKDDFNGPAGTITSRAPVVDLKRGAWVTTSPATALALPGNGQLISPDQTAAHLAAVALLPSSPFAVIEMRAIVTLPAGDANWIGFGLADGVHSLTTAKSGPWAELHGSGLVNLYSGSGTNGVNTQTVTNNGGPVEVVLTYDACNARMSLTFGGAPVFSDVAVVHSPGSVPRGYAVIEFSQNAGEPAAFSVDDFSVDIIPRPRPILSLPITDTIFVHNYGAVAGDALDDSPGIQAALTAAKTLSQTPGKIVELRFDPGQYVINTQTSEPPAASGCAVQLTGAQNVWVNGNGAEILITNIALGFLRLFQCTNCIVENFTVDCDPLPWTEGDVVTVNSSSGASTATTVNNYVEIDLRPGFPDPTMPSFAAAPTQWGAAIDRNNLGRLRDNSQSSYAKIGAITQVAGFPARYRIPLNETNTNTATIVPGDLWIQQARGAGSLFNPVQCTRVTLIGLTNYAGGGPNFTGSYNRQLGVVNCHVRIKAGRSKSTDADGIVQQKNRIAPWIEGCTFEGLMDDAVNLTTDPFVILETNVGGNPAAYRVALLSGNSTAKFAAIDFSVGDHLSFFNPINGTVFNQAFVVSVDQPGQILVLSAVIPDIVTPPPPGNGVPPQTGVTQSNTLVYNDSLNSSGVIVNNQFLNSRRFGVYCKASHTLIADNTFVGLSASPICVTNELGSFAGGLFPSHLLIARNLFSECGNDRTAITASSINLAPNFASIAFHKFMRNPPAAGDNYVTAGREFENILILENAFTGWRRAAIWLMNCNGAEIIGNTFGQPKTDFAAPSPGHRLIDIHHSDNIRIANNSTLAAAGIVTHLQTSVTGLVTDNPFDATQPTLGPVNIASSNANVAWAKLGDTVTVNFTASEPIKAPGVTLLGVVTTAVNLGGNQWTATATVGAGTDEGTAGFTIAFSDLAGNAGSVASTTTDASSVTLDKTAPMLSLPANITVSAASAAGAVVTYSASATDNIDSAPVVMATPSSGSVFPIGTTTVNATATDAAGNSAAASFDVTVHTAQQSWRQFYFGTTSDSGNAADGFDFDFDGLMNLMEWACGLNPTTASTLPTTLVRNGGNLEFTYTRSVEAVNAGATFIVEWSDTLVAESWSTAGVVQQELSDNGTLQQVKATLPAGSSGRRFVRLRVLAPPGG